MFKKVLIAIILTLPLTTTAQTTYDSLLNVYTIKNIFDEKKALNISYKQLVDRKLSQITNPEMNQLASCAIVKNLYGIPFLSDNELMSMINGVLKNPANKVIEEKASSLKKEMLRELVGSTVKPLAFPNMKGDTIKLADVYTAGKDYVIIDLWATWCGPCVASMKKFNALKEKYNIEVYSISIDDTFEKVKKFVEKNPSYTWPIVYGSREAGLHPYFKIRAIPTYFIVDKTGLIVATHVGGDPERELKRLYRK